MSNKKGERAAGKITIRFYLIQSFILISWQWVGAWSEASEEKRSQQKLGEI
jgi:hypothetical protein